MIGRREVGWLAFNMDKASDYRKQRDGWMAIAIFCTGRTSVTLHGAWKLARATVEEYVPFEGKKVAAPTHDGDWTTC